MSDADDGFDREAERRKLEEKYGDDDERRASTQRMSDLLLKGATMTNSHCDNCGDPIFRQNGQEFCPTCSANTGANSTGEPAPANDAREPAPANASGSTDGRSDQSTADTSERQQTAAGTDGHQQTAAGADGQAGGSSSTPPAGASGGAAPPERPAETEPSSETVRATGRERSRAGSATGQSSRAGHGETGGVRGASESAERDDTAAGGDLAAARAALTEAVATHAARGTETTDPRTAADHLAAAREAAEALSALRR